MVTVNEHPESGMKLLVTLLATFLTLYCAGWVLVLFILPATSIIPDLMRSKSGTAEIAGIIYSTLLHLFALIAGALVVRDMLRRSLEPFARATLTATLIASAVAAVDVLVALVSQDVRFVHVFWLDALVILSALAYIYYGEQVRSRSGY